LPCGAPLFLPFLLPFSPFRFFSSSLSSSLFLPFLLSSSLPPLPFLPFLLFSSLSFSLSPSHSLSSLSPSLSFPSFFSPPSSPSFFLSSLLSPPFSLSLSFPLFISPPLFLPSFGILIWKYQIGPKLDLCIRQLSQILPNSTLIRYRDHGRAGAVLARLRTAFRLLGRHRIPAHRRSHVAQHGKSRSGLRRNCKIRRPSSGAIPPDRNRFRVYVSFGCPAVTLPSDGSCTATPSVCRNTRSGLRALLPAPRLTSLFCSILILSVELFESARPYLRDILSWTLDPSCWAVEEKIRNFSTEISKLDQN